MHAKRYWPAAITTILWPFGLLESVEFHNLWEIGEDGHTPMMRLLNLWEFPDMKMEHIFGCPVYNLDSKLQSSSIGPPKWDPRTRLGIYVGRSPYHAGSVALVLNPRTGHVSPQYHLVFGDDFSTVPFMHSNDVPNHWEALVKSSTELATDEDFSIVETWYEQSMNEFDIEKENASFEPQQELDQSIKKISFADPPVEGKESKPGVLTKVVEEKEPEPELQEVTQVSEGESNPLVDEFINLETTGLGRSPRTNKGGPLSKGCFFSKVFTMIPTIVFMLYSHINEALCYTSKLVSYLQALNTYYDGTINLIHNYAMTTLKNNDNDVYTFKDMLKQEDRMEFIKAMFEELDGHHSRGH